MPQPVFLRIPPDLAKRQLDGRIKETRDNSHAFIYFDSSRLQWHQGNIPILSAMFTSDEILSQYNGIAAISASGKAPSHDKVRELRSFLEQLRDSISSFPVLPAEVSQQPGTSAIQSSHVSPPAPSTSRPTNEVLKWEFYSAIVDDPTLGGSIPEAVFQKTLKEAAADGWELVSAVPVIYTEQQVHGSSRWNVEAHRLFFKRPAR